MAYGRFNPAATAKASTPEAFDKLVRDEIVTRRKVFAAARVKPE